MCLFFFTQFRLDLIFLKQLLFMQHRLSLIQLKLTSSPLFMFLTLGIFLNTTYTDIMTGLFNVH